MEFIAEIGLNHNGSDALLVELIRQASISGASYVKFQLGWRDKKDEINFFDETKLKLLLKSCDHYSISPLFTLLHEDSYQLLTKLHKPKILKIASRTLENDLNFCIKLSQRKHDLIISTGMSQRSISKINSVRNLMQSNCKFVWCMSNYPLYSWDVIDFPKEFNINGFYGLSDHSLGNEMAFLAIARGAKSIEKHFTIDKSDSTIRDHALSSTQEEFCELVKIGKNLSKLASDL